MTAGGCFAAVGCAETRPPAPTAPSVPPAAAASAAARRDPMAHPSLAGLPDNILPVEALVDTTGKFMENMAFDRQGRLYVTSVLEKRIYRWEEGQGLSAFADLNIFPMSLAEDVDGSWIVVGSPVDFTRGMAAYERAQQVSRLSADGKRIEPVADFPAARALNGLVRLSPGVFLIADSYAGAIWRLDVPSRTVSLWMKDLMLDRVDPNRVTPGANGVKLFRGQLVVSNTQRMNFVHVEITPDGKAGKFRVQQHGIVVDDFDLLEDGTAFVTTHRQVIVRVSPDGRSQVVGNHPLMRGNTACLMGVRPEDRNKLYVVGDGGVFFGAGGPSGITRITVR